MNKPNKSYVEFAPESLTLEHMGPDKMLRDGTLFTGCNVPACREHGLKLMEAPKYPMRLRGGARSWTARGLPSLATFKTLTQQHAKKHGETDKASQVAKVAKAFTFAAGVAQATTKEEEKKPTSTKEEQEKPTSTEEEGADPDPVVLRMPHAKAATGTYEQYRQARYRL